MDKITNRVFLIAIALATIWSCATDRPSEGSRKAGQHITNTVTAIAETDPVPQNKNEDSADDPAIWIDTTDVLQSFVIGTDKKGGLATYNLDGKLLNYYPDGNMNNVDLRTGFVLAGSSIDVLAASNRSTHSISLYKVQSSGVLEPIHARTIVSDMQDEVYGLGMYRSPKSGKFYVYLNSKAGEVEQWELYENNKKIDAKRVRSFNLGTQTEGVVADDTFKVVYIGEEVAGIYKFDAEPDASTEGKFIALSSEENNNIRFDIEGLTIYDSGNGEGYLIASSQGNYSYAIFERRGDNKYLGSFRIVDGEIDGAEETDGIDVSNVPLGPNYPKGIFVVQDGYNYGREELLSQNFKFISWEEIEKVILQN